jgi:hypothetical protein
MAAALQCRWRGPMSLSGDAPTGTSACRLCRSARPHSQQEHDLALAEVERVRAAALRAALVAAVRVALDLDEAEATATAALATCPTCHGLIEIPEAPKRLACTCPTCADCGDLIIDVEGPLCAPCKAVELVEAEELDAVMDELDDEDEEF